LARSVSEPVIPAVILDPGLDLESI